MSAVAQKLDVESGLQQDWVGGSEALVAVKPPAIRKKIVIAEQATAPSLAQVDPTDHPGQAYWLSENHRKALARIATTPIVPLAWVRGTTQVTPEEVGERKSGRPRLIVRKTMDVAHLDNSLLYIQRRTRELQKIIKGSQPSQEHTTKIITAAIKDAVRKLCSTLPDEKRDAIDEVVAQL